jgi:putative glutamine amidotransferase
MSRPLIGLPGRRKTAAQVEGFPQALHGLDIDLYLADYSRSVLHAGGLPVNLPLDADPCQYLPHLSGIVLTGGADIEPEFYGQDPDGNGGYEPERDELELALLAGALDAGLPVLGICRGLQLLNVHSGGTLHQHRPLHARYDVDPSARVHPVSFDAGSCLQAILGPRVTVNSLHHQTVDRLGGGLVVTGRADDDTIEGIEIPGRPVIAVQWHPEMLSNADPLFSWLIEQANRSSRPDG